MTERFMRLTERVDDLQAAFTFVMAHLEDFPSPSVTIQHVTLHSDPPDNAYDVTLYGTLGQP
jgi:hypothetical protein